MPLILGIYLTYHVSAGVFAKFVNTKLFITALLGIINNNLKCWSIGDWLNISYHTHETKYATAIKKNMKYLYVLIYGKNSNLHLPF